MLRRECNTQPGIVVKTSPPGFDVTTFQLPKHNLVNSVYVSRFCDKSGYTNHISYTVIHVDKQEQLLHMVILIGAVQSHTVTPQLHAAMQYNHTATPQTLLIT